MCAGDLCGRLAVDGWTVQAMQGSNIQVSNDVFMLGSPFRKIDAHLRKGAGVENSSEEFDPGSD